MGISVDTVNLRFNVKPDYDQQQLQQLQEDLKNGQKELEKTRRAMDKLAKNGLNAMTKEQRAEFDKLSSSSSKLAAELHRNEKRMQEYTRSANVSKLSIHQLGQRAKDLSAVLNNLNPNSDDMPSNAESDSIICWLIVYFSAQIASFTLTMMQYNILCTVKRFEAYETNGALFREATAGTLELSVADGIWELILDTILEIAEMISADASELLSAVIDANPKFHKLYQMYKLVA